MYYYKHKILSIIVFSYVIHWLKRGTNSLKRKKKDTLKILFTYNKAFDIVGYML